MEFFWQFHPHRNHRVAIRESKKVVVLKFVDVLPNDVAIPVNLNQRRVVATQARDMVFKRRRCFRRFIFRRFGRVDVRTGHQQIAVFEQAPVARLDMAKDPAMDYASINIDKVRSRIAVRGQ